MEWISVKDRLPPEKEAFLCYGFICYFDDYPIDYDDLVICIARRDLSDFITCYDSDCRYVLGVTDWMPLPEEPKST